MGLTPVYGFPYPAVSDSPNGPAQIQSLAEGVEAKLALTDASVVAVGARVAKLEGENAYYKQTSAQANAITAATWTKQKFPIAVETSPIITPNGTFDIFTINRTGWLDIETAIRCNITNVNTVRYLYGFFFGTDVTFATPLKVQTIYEPEAASNSTSIGMTLTRKFTAGDTLAVAINRIGVGGGGGNPAATEALGETNHIAFSWRGED